MIEKEQYKEVYSLLNDITPLARDCGELCGAICCRRDDKGSSKESYLYMLPGEEEIHDMSDSWLTWFKVDSKESGFPDSWGTNSFAVRCSGPDKCHRSKRPIQCRTFPLSPHLTIRGKLKLILFDDQLPYLCPIINEEKALSVEFLDASYKVWNILLQDERIKEFVKQDSKRRRSLWHSVRYLYPKRSNK